MPTSDAPRNNPTSLTVSAMADGSVTSKRDGFQGNAICCELQCPSQS
jgi:hypothetical protein